MVIPVPENLPFGDLQARKAASMLTTAKLGLSNSTPSLVLKPHAFLCSAGARLGWSTQHPL